MAIGLLIGLLVGFVLGNMNQHSREIFPARKLPSMQDIIVGWRRW